MLRLFGRFGFLQHRHESLLQDVLGLPVAQAQRPPIKDQPGRLGLINLLTPCEFRVVHTINLP